VLFLGFRVQVSSDTTASEQTGVDPEVSLTVGKLNAGLEQLYCSPRKQSTV
jgi:hypothetical protein